MEFSPPICNINLLTGLSMIGDFSGGYSQRDCHLNFKIIVNVTVDSYMNSSFNFNFSHLLKYFLDFRIMKFEITSKITAQFETIPQYLLFFSLFFYTYLRNKRDISSIK